MDNKKVRIEKNKKSIIKKNKKSTIIKYEINLIYCLQNLPQANSFKVFQYASYRQHKYAP